MPASDQGIDVRKYLVIPRTLIFLFNSRDEVLLLRGSQTKRLWAGLFNGIGGHIEAGEDILAAAKRELYEETGIADVDIYLCGQIMVDVNRDAGVSIFIFKGSYDGQNLIPSNEGDLAWVRISELDTIPLVEDLTVILPRAAAFQPGDRTMIGIYSYDPDGNLKVSLQP